MKLETGYVYHIKNEYFDLVKDNKLMRNHEGNATRPNYFCIKKEDSNLLWFIPMSSKVEKYKSIMSNQIKKHNECNTIFIGKYRNRETAFLLQNMFPVTAKYIDHIDTVKGRTQKIAAMYQVQIKKKVNNIFKLKEKGINLIFPDVDKISNILIAELRIDKIFNTLQYIKTKDDLFFIYDNLNDKSSFEKVVKILDKKEFCDNIKNMNIKDLENKRVPSIDEISSFVYEKLKDKYTVTFLDVLDDVNLLFGCDETLVPKTNEEGKIVVPFTEKEIEKLKNFTLKNIEEILEVNSLENEGEEEEEDEL